MNADPLNQQETDRLQALSSYHILDTSKEPEFEDLTELAAYICDAPVAFISFIDDKRQWFKSIKGLNKTEISRCDSLCEKTLKDSNLHHICDLLADSKFSTNPFVQEDPVKRFYAGIPLLSKDGFVLGTLCVIDYRPKDLTKEQSFYLPILAKQIERCLELRRETYLRNVMNEKVVKLNKTSSLGLMTAYVAHEINNSVGILNGYTTIAISELEDRSATSDVILPYLRKIQGTTLRISKVIKSIKSYTRESEQDPFEKTSVYNILEETQDLCEERCNFLNTKLSVEFPEQNTKFECHSTQITQVMLNLINNSLDAIAENETKWIKVQADQLLGNASVRFMVTDSGPGIPEEIVNNLTEPFFTTKEKGKGTGLGLNISKSIIESHKGNFFYDRESKNTRFGFELPQFQNERAGPDRNPALEQL